MSNIEVNKCGNAMRTLGTLFCSARFNEQDYANASAYISQRGVKVENQDEVYVLKTMLSEWGVGFDSVIHVDVDGARTWVYDSINFLSRNPAVIGFMIKHSKDNWRGVKMVDKEWEWQENMHEWESVPNHEIITRVVNYNCPAFIVWKQWMPIKQWLETEEPFHIRNESTETCVRWEYEPTSCWLPQKTKYNNKDKAVAKMLRKWATPCLISNAKQFLTLSPGENGWESENIMEFDGLPTGTIADRIAGQASAQIETYIKRNPSKKKEIMPYVAHALMSVATRFGIKINHKTLSAFHFEDKDEIEKLKKNEAEMCKTLTE